MPFDRSKYPDDWEAISKRIRKRENNRCKFCGAENYKPHPITGSDVVLTVAHLNHDVADNSDENLAALCQRCHLTYDAKLHAMHAAETRRKKQVEAGQMELLPAPASGHGRE